MIAPAPCPACSAAVGLAERLATVDMDVTSAFGDLQMRVNIGLDELEHLIGSARARHSAGCPNVVSAPRDAAICQCTHEAGDSDCPVHPTCADCGSADHRYDDCPNQNRPARPPLPCCTRCRQQLADPGPFVAPECRVEVAMAKHACPNQERQP